jgi:hypothetical protein
MTAFMLLAGLLCGTFIQPTTARDDSDMPPAGWKEYTPKDKSFRVWIPEKAKNLIEKEQTTPFNGPKDKEKMKQNTLLFDFAGGLSYLLQESTLPNSATTHFKHGELVNLFRPVMTADIGGKITDEKDVMAGAISGKEYRSDGTNGHVRGRVFVNGGRVLLLRVKSEKKDALDGDNAKNFLESAMFISGAAAAKTPKIIGGGGGDTEAKDLAPEGGLLIGLEVGTSKFNKTTVVRAVRPIYLVGDKEVMGEQRGTDTSKVVTLRAKSGYAVGAMSVKQGLGLDGLSLTFFKVTDGKLNPKDSYESEFVGTIDKKTAPKVGGDGTAVLGIATRSNKKDMMGMGLIFKGQEDWEPKQK